MEIKLTLRFISCSSLHNNNRYTLIEKEGHPRLLRFPMHWGFWFNIHLIWDHLHETEGKYRQGLLCIHWKNIHIQHSPWVHYMVEHKMSWRAWIQSWYSVCTCVCLGNTSFSPCLIWRRWTSAAWHARSGPWRMFGISAWSAGKTQRRISSERYQLVRSLIWITDP